MNQQTYDNLMAAFWALYCHQGIEKVTVKAITAKAGYNRSTFYEYFKDPYDMLEQLKAKLIPNLETLPPAMTPSGEIGMPLQAFFSLYETNAPYYAVLLGEKGDPGFSHQLKSSLKPLLVQTLGTQSAKNSKVPKDPAYLDFLLEYVLSAMIGVMAYWFKNPQGMSQEALYQMLQVANTEGVFKLLFSEPVLDQPGSSSIR